MIDSDLDAIPGGRDGLKAWWEVCLAVGEHPGLVYLAGPLRGDGQPETIRQNKLRMLHLARAIQPLLPGATLVVPHLALDHLDESGAGGLQVREQALRDCERLLACCRHLVLVGEPSPGMLHEQEFAEELGIPWSKVPGWEKASTSAPRQALEIR